MKWLVLVVLFFGLKCEVKSSKILVISTMPAHSHFTLAFRLAKVLAEKQHQVTFINPYPQKKIKNYRHITVEDSVDYAEEFKKVFFEMNSWGPIERTVENLNFGVVLTELTFNDTDVQNLLNSNESFDVVIIEHFLNDALAGVAHHFKAPLVFLAPVPSCSKNNYLFGNPSPSSYVPDIMGTFTKHMNFWERLQNFLDFIAHDLAREIFYLPKQRELFKKYIKTDLELDDVLYNISLMLTTSHPSINDAIPHLPSIIEIGGYHVSPPEKLPSDLQSYLDNATEGVVLFSMGSNLKSKDLTPEVRRSLLKAFSKIKQKVLWKFETDLPEAPDNVKILKWLPQQDILVHPNIRCFITHGGLLSTIEAVYFGVPIIGIPVFGDQESNIAAAVSNGYAISSPLALLTEESFSAALDQILNNPKYKENVQLRSRLMHDQPLKPIDSAVYWIEHVIRHKGAPHLRSAGLDLKWYQREMIDIISFLVIIAGTTLTTIYIVLKFIVTRLFFSKRKTKIFTTKDKKNK